MIGFIKNVRDFGKVLYSICYWIAPKDIINSCCEIAKKKAMPNFLSCQNISSLAKHQPQLFM